VQEKKNGKDFFKDEPFPVAFVEGEDLEKLNKTIRKAYLGFYLRPRYIISRLSKGDFPSLFRQIKLFFGYL